MKDPNKPKKKKSVSFAQENEVREVQGNDSESVDVLENATPEKSKKYPQNLKSDLADVPINKSPSAPLTPEEELEKFQKECAASFAAHWGIAFNDKAKADSEISIGDELSSMSNGLADIINVDFALQIKINDAFNKDLHPGKTTREKLEDIVKNPEANLTEEQKQELLDLGDKLIKKRKSLQDFAKVSVTDRLAGSFNQIVDEVPRNPGNPLIEDYCNKLKENNTKKNYLNDLNLMLKEQISSVFNDRNNMELKKYCNRISAKIANIDDVFTKLKEQEEKKKILDEIFEKAGLENKKDKIHKSLDEITSKMDINYIRSRDFKDGLEKILKANSHTKIFTRNVMTIETKKLNSIRDILSNDPDPTHFSTPNVSSPTKGRSR